MINTNLLKAKVALIGMTFKDVAKKTGIDYQGLNSRKVGRIEFTAKEIKVLKEVLNLTNDEVAEIFLV